MTTVQRARGEGVVIVGSANMDVVVTVDRHPNPGETLLAESTERFPGGKGLNQAIAAARSGAATTFIGALGEDGDGAALASVMTDAGILTDLVRRAVPATGQAYIVVDAHAENTIIVASGANATVTSLTSADRKAVAAARVVVLQLELPLSVVSESASVGRASGTLVVLNAAPAQVLPFELLELVDCLIVNEHEAVIVGGGGVADDGSAGDGGELAAASARLAALVPILVVTLGAAGSQLWENGARSATVDAPTVTPIDTTGAGDTFCGALAAGLAAGEPLESAARFATAAAALSVQAPGAVPSIPTRDRIEAALAEL